LGVACGLAYSIKNFEKLNNKIYCVMGDGEI
jgi:transketolase N-terminal domain/subunit